MPSPPSSPSPTGGPSWSATSQRRRTVGAFTLLELVAVILILAILAVMAMPVVANLQKRAQVAACANNLKNLYVATNGYVQEHNGWPQISAPDVRKQGYDASYVTAWQAALKPYGIPPLTWVCPELHRQRGRPDLTVPANLCVDYLATTFDSRPRTPYEHSNMPWFVETTNAHGGGQLIIFSNGSVMGMKEAVATFAGKPGQTR